MASSTNNVKLGVCRVYFDGHDLGYTKGGVELEVTTETHKTTVDQFGDTVIAERIRGRNVMATCPLAETTLDNLVSVMPGATLVTDGVKATGSMQFTAILADDTVTVNGVVFTAKASPATATEFGLGASLAEAVDNLADVLSASTNSSVSAANYVSNGTNTVNVTYGTRGTAGNSFTLASDSVGATISATLTGGVAETKSRVDVTDSVGTDLLAIAKELRLHPKDNADNNRNDDVVIPLAATAGALNFAYKIDEERVYNVVFNGYPDSANNDLLFQVGDKAAV